MRLLATAFFLLALMPGAILPEGRIAFVGPAAAAPAIKRGDTVKLNFSTFGCAKPEDTRRFVELMSQKDTVAAARFVSSSKVDCLHFKHGSEARTEDISAWNNMACVRRIGEPECRWLPLDFVDPN